MWFAIAIFTIAAAVICSLSAVMLRMQPIGAEPGLVNRIAGLTIGRGFRLIQRWRLTGARQLIVATLVSWAMWSILGGLTIAIVAPGYNPGRMWLIYGILCGVVGAALGFVLSFLAAATYARVTRMSTFEGAAGYFVMFMAMIGGLVGALSLGIAMSMFFHQQGS